MDLRRFSLPLLVVGLVWLMPARAFAVPPPAVKDCTAAYALLDAGDFEDAQKSFVALLTQTPALPCAGPGLTRALAGAPPPPTVALCAAADQQFADGKLIAARAEYMNLGRDSACAATGLAAIRDVERLCAQGNAELANHHKDTALKTFEAGVAKGPKAECVTTGLSAATSTVAARTIDTSVTVLEDAGEVAGILLAALFLLLLLGHSKRVWRKLVRIPIIRGLLGPRLSLDPLLDAAAGDNPKIGESLAARMRERLQRYQAEALEPTDDDTNDDIYRADPRERFAQVVSGSSTLQNALGQVRDVGEHGAFISALLNLLYAMLPIRRLSVTGVLDPPAAGSGATLSFQVGSKLAAATALKPPPPAAAEVPPAPDPVGDLAKYFTLVEPGAVWVQYEVARNISGIPPSPNEAESYVLLRSGLDVKATNPVAAKQFFEQAISLNECNWAAYVNLSTVTAELAAGPGEPGQIADGGLNQMVVA